MGFESPLCHGCAFRLKVHRESVVPRRHTGDVHTWHRERLLAISQLMDGGSSSDSPHSVQQIVGEEPDDADCGRELGPDEVEDASENENDLADQAAAAMEAAVPTARAESVVGSGTEHGQTDGDESDDDEPTFGGYQL